MKTILITGATGFLGGRIAQKLTKENNIVILKRSFSDISKIKDLTPQWKYYDIDKIDIDKIFQENNFDAIIHTATNYGSFGGPATAILSANLMFPLSLFEAGVKYGVRTFINTDTFYNTEDTAYGYLQRYAISKHQFTQWLRILSGKIKIINLKIGVIYGPGDNHNKFTMQMISDMLDDKPEIALTHGMQKRDFLYIEEAAMIYEFILKHMDKIDEGFNDFDIGTGNLISIKNFVDTIHKLIESKSVLDYGNLPYRDNEIMEPKSDISKLLKLGWQPKISLEKGLQNTIDYVKDFPEDHG